MAKLFDVVISDAANTERVIKVLAEDVRQALEKLAGHLQEGDKVNSATGQETDIVL